LPPYPPVVSIRQFRVPFLASLIDPRRKRFWELLFGLGLAFRIYAILVLRNPMDVLFSDPYRHWDNAAHFLDPGAMGASNPYVYQLYLFLVQRVTRDDRFAIGLITAALSVTYALVWYGFALSVFRRRVNALRFAVVLCWLPSHISMFGFFMNETIVLPLVGLALWLTRRTLDRRSPWSFVATATTWTLAVLTRSVVGPVGLACVLGSWIRLRRRRWLALTLSSAITGVWLVAASIHAHGVLKRYTPFGDNLIQTIYFVAGTRDYSIDVKGHGTYIFASPSLFVSPFTPFSEFRSIREGDLSFTLDPDERGRDVQKTLHEQLDKNWKKLPRLVYENVIFLSFGHSWPWAGSIGDLADKCCLWERWIWLPLTIISLIGCTIYGMRHQAEFVPLVTLGFIFTFFVIAEGGGFMEGRYRKPFEPLVLLAPIWLWERRHDPGCR
jgi:hypothetical protein